MQILIIASILGLGVAAVLPKNFGMIYRVLVAPGLGLFTFAQITLIFSFFFGVGPESIIISLFLTAVISIVCFLKFKSKESLNLSLIFLITAIIATIFLSYIWFTQTLFASSAGLWVGGGGMYGDTALHAAYTSRFATGEFPIQNPLYAGKILIYPFANDLLSAILRISGLNFNLSFILPQILFLVGFITLFYKTARKFTSNGGFLIALLILFLGWGAGWFFFLGEWLNSHVGFWQFLSRDYTNNSQYNLYFHNILTGLILPERSFLPGLFLGLLIFLHFDEYYRARQRRYLIIVGVILGTLPLWHTHTFIYFAITMVIYCIWLIIKDRSKKLLIDLCFMSLASLIFVMPSLILFFLNHNFGNFIHMSKGWQNGNENIVLFWLKNSLLTIPLAIGGFLILKRNLKIYFIPAFVVFIMANLVIFQPWDWDNIKLLSWSLLFFAILCGFLLERVAKINNIFKPLVLVIILVSVLSGILSILLQLKNSYVLYDHADLDLVNWAKANTKASDVFIIDPVPNHPIPGLSGRLVYMGYPGHLWVHGIDYSERENLNKSVIKGDFALIDKTELPISYIVLPKSNIPDNYKYQLVFENNKYAVFKNPNLLN